MYSLDRARRGYASLISEYRPKRRAYEYDILAIYIAGRQGEPTCDPSPKTGLTQQISGVPDAGRLFCVMVVTFIVAVPQNVIWED
jgi:hypothetical protein